MPNIFDPNLIFFSPMPCSHSKPLPSWVASRLARRPPDQVAPTSSALGWRKSPKMQTGMLVCKLSAKGPEGSDPQSKFGGPGGQPSAGSYILG